MSEEILTKEDIKAVVEEVLRHTPADKAFTPGTDGEIVKDETDKVLGGPGPFKSFSHFAHSIYKAGRDGRNASEELRRWDEATKTAGHMAEEDMAQGGYLVPVEFRAQLLMTSIEASIVRNQKPMIIPMQTNRVNIPAVVDTSHATTLFGGVRIYRPGEAEQKTASKPALGQVSLNLHKLTGLVYVSDELMEDSPISLQPLLTRMFGEAIAFEQDDDCLMGNGVNRALGAFNAANPSLIAVAKETGQTAATIMFENIVKMWQRVHPRSRGNAVWLANVECQEQLDRMSMAVGTGGVPVYLPANGISGKPYDTLRGRPLIFTEKMQALGTQGDIGIADFTQYLIGEKAGGIQAAQSIHLRFDYDEIAFRFVLRHDGQPWWLGTLTPRRGTATLSPFVVLAART